jgi:hypothetical protein
MACIRALHSSRGLYSSKSFKRTFEMFVRVICPLGLLKFCTIRLGRQFMSCPRFTQRVSVEFYETTLTKIFCAEQNFIHTLSQISCINGGGYEAGRNYRCPAVRQGARGPSILYMVKFFSVLSSVDCTNSFKTNPNHSTAESPSSQFSVKSF